MSQEVSQVTRASRDRHHRMYHHRHRNHILKCVVNLVVCVVVGCGCCARAPGLVGPGRGSADSRAKDQSVVCGTRGFGGLRWGLGVRDELCARGCGRIKAGREERRVRVCVCVFCVWVSLAFVS